MMLPEKTVQSIFVEHEDAWNAFKEDVAKSILKKMEINPKI